MEQGRYGLTPRIQRRCQMIHFDAAKIRTIFVTCKFFGTFLFGDVDVVLVGDKLHDLWRENTHTRSQP